MMPRRRFGKRESRPSADSLTVSRPAPRFRGFGGCRAMSRDYKSTVFLPRTDFPMRGNLQVREPDLLARWARDDLYRLQREAAQGRETFTLQDGQPSANGHLTIGPAPPHIRRAVINRAPNTPGQ